MKMIALRIVASILFVTGLLGSAHAADPAAMKSLQPFQKFAKGEGEGVAFEYKSRNKAQLVALLRDKALAKKEMRAPCEVLVRQMTEAHPGLPFEGCVGAAAAIERDNDFAVVACEDPMFIRDNWLAVTNEEVSAWGAWHRKCLVGEQVLVYKGQPIISTMCLNVSFPVAAQVAPPVAVPPPVVAASAAKVSPYGLQINCFRDRPDGYLQNLYDVEKANRTNGLANINANKVGMMAYYNVFTRRPFSEMLTERKSRPQDCKFLVRFLTKEPVLDILPSDTTDVRAQKYANYLWKFQNPVASNVISSQWVSTGALGWVPIPITIPLGDFEAILIQPEQIGDVLEPVIAVHRPEIATQSNPAHVWEVWLK